MKSDLSIMLVCCCGGTAIGYAVAWVAKWVLGVP